MINKSIELNPGGVDVIPSRKIPIINPVKDDVSSEANIQQQTSNDNGSIGFIPNIFIEKTVLYWTKIKTINIKVFIRRNLKMFFLLFITLFFAPYTALSFKRSDNHNRAKFFNFGKRFYFGIDGIIVFVDADIIYKAYE